jgi:hypothetical protein
MMTIALNVSNETRYKKALVNILYYQALGMSKEELQPILFFDEETTDAWTVEQCRILYVQNQLEFIQDENLDDEIEETWNIVYKKEMV